MAILGHIPLSTPASTDLTPSNPPRAFCFPDPQDYLRPQTPNSQAPLDPRSQDPCSPRLPIPKFWSPQIQEFPRH